MMRASRRDTNHAAIQKALEQVGCSVQDLSRVGGGCPDLAVAFRGVNYFIEIKREKSKGIEGGKLRATQETWLARWKGPAFVVRTAQEALEAIGAIANQGTVTFAREAFAATQGVSARQIDAMMNGEPILGGNSRGDDMQAPTMPKGEI